MRIIYELNDESQDDMATKALFDRARDFYSALTDIDDKCRGILKHGDPNEDTEGLCEEIRQICADADIWGII